TFDPIIEDGFSMGVPRGELEEFRTHAQEAADADDLEEVYRLKGDLQERLLEAKRKQIVKRSMDEVQTLDEIVTQTERLDIPVESARTRLDDDREREEARGRARGRRELPEQGGGGAPDQRHGDGGHPDQAGGSLHRDADPEFHQEPVSKSLPASTEFRAPGGRMESVRLRDREPRQAAREERAGRARG